MSHPSNVRRALAGFLLLAALGSASGAQELPLSGVTGFDLVYATSGATSQLFAVNLDRSFAPIPLGPAVAGVPSRWAHRRRTLGGLETSIAHAGFLTFFTPMGDALGNGAIHVVDLRGGLVSTLNATGNPAGYDLAVVEPLNFVFSAEDDGAGNTLLRGYSYAVAGPLTPLSPPTIACPGPPSAYTNRIGIDLDALELVVPTAVGVQIVELSASAPHMSAVSFVSALPAAPTTNPVQFDRNGTPTWIVGTSTFSGSAPLAAGYLSWSTGGPSSSATFGTVPTDPSKQWVPAAGTEELAVVGNGTDTYVYYLLREPPPNTFFVKPSSIGVVRFLASGPPLVGSILMPDEVGEPFAIPAVHGTRVAFESSFGPPFLFEPPDGGEKVSVIYSPLDPLGSSSLNGVLGVPGPLGGRISTRGMDRPIWSRDGTRVLSATSHFPGAPHPGVPGLEVLDVPAGTLLNLFVSPHTAVANLPFPNQSIVFPSSYRPRIPALASSVAGLTFFGNLFNQGQASLLAASFGEIGQVQVEPGGFPLPPSAPNFRSILPPAFGDAFGGTSIPASFGARRTSFNLLRSLGLMGVTMVAASEDEVLVQLTGVNVLASLGLDVPVPMIRVALPAGSVTTTEFLSL
jgi:hypothetical protein